MKKQDFKKNLNSFQLVLKLAIFSMQHILTVKTLKIKNNKRFDTQT